MGAIVGLILALTLGAGPGGHPSPGRGHGHGHGHKHRGCAVSHEPILANPPPCIVDWGRHPL